VNAARSRRFFGRSRPSGVQSPAVGQLVDIETVDGIATITLNSPANRNALSQQLLADLHAALDAAEQHVARVVVLTHTAPVFCSGADLKERAGGKVDSTSYVRAIERLGCIAAPVIAAVDGPVRAGGLGVMAACDLVVVNPTITFALTEVRIGVAPAIVSAPLLQRCGWSKLAAAFLTGEAFDTTKALDMGLVTHITDDVAATVGQLSRDILLGGPNALAITKALLRRPHTMAELQAISESLFTSDEGREGMAAFAEKRPPRWTQ
jgi:methylglutaconyl-CoA hydratase